MNIETAVTVAAILGVITLVWGAVKLVKRYPCRSVMVLCAAIVITAPITITYVTKIITDPDMAAAVSGSMGLIVLFAAVAGFATFVTYGVDGKK